MQKTTQQPTSSPREAAYFALLAAAKSQAFIEDHLEQWSKSCTPTTKNYSLAHEIAFGAERQKVSLDFLAKQCAKKGKLSLKLKERILLRTALYQYYFMDRVPIYAIANETVALAQTHCHPTFTKFLNAILRSLPQTKLQLPPNDDPESLSIRYSFPRFYVEKLLSIFGIARTKTIMDAQNTASLTTVRIRPRAQQIFPSLSILVEKPFPVAIIQEKSLLNDIAESKDYFIQNATPATLLGELCSSITAPANVLDLCASPGGKIVAFHDFFPQATLHANDISHKKLLRLQENLKKFNLKAQISSSPGEHYHHPEPFEVIIADVPCSNSGVLNKRPEARWRLSSESIDQLNTTQLAIACNALKLVKPGGHLWYMTCSILQDENEKILDTLCTRFNVRILYKRTILPNKQGWDGGFAAALQKKS